MTVHFRACRQCLPIVAGTALLLAGFAACAPEADRPPEGPPPAPPKVARSLDGVVVAAQPLAAQAGAAILQAGGNAADAAVAAAFAVSVVEPSMNSIGGRTQILVRRPDGSFAGIDATTQAPSTYDPETAPQAGYGYPTVGVPGAVAGLLQLLEEHGTMSREQVMARAIGLAAGGFRILPGEAARHAAGAGQLAEFPGSAAHFLVDGESREAGALFAQPDLAATLRAIAAGGADAFYRGSIAERIAADMNANGGAVTAESLAEYRAEDARIVRGNYRGYDLVGTHVPAAGAVTIGILHVLENFDMAALDPDEWAALVGTAVAEVFARREGLGGPDGEPTTDKAWAAEVAAQIELPGVELPRAAQGFVPDPGRFVAARAGQTVTGGNGRNVMGGNGRNATGAVAAMGLAAREHDWVGTAWDPASSHTTHLSAADGQGMYVSLTQTIGPNLGSKVTTPGLGFLYAATLGGYLGHMEPGERARSSISPFMVLRDGEPVLVLGAAGGARIVSAVVQAVLRVVDQGMSLPDALAAARVHPIDGGIAMETSPEIGWTPETVAEVESMGLAVQTMERDGAFGRIHGIWIDPETGVKVGVADPDWEGAAAIPGKQPEDATGDETDNTTDGQ